MEIRIWPRKANERGGYAMMPMRKNIPEGRVGWKLTTCPECGRECWETPPLPAAIRQGAIALCTECAMRKGIGIS